MSDLIFRSVTTSPYTSQNGVKEVINPLIGSVLVRRDNKSVDYYVVVTTFNKKTGVNKGIVDKIILEPVESFIPFTSSIPSNSCNPDTLILIKRRKCDYPMVLSLSSNGQWWTKDMCRQHNFEFLVYPPIISSTQSILSQLPQSQPINIPTLSPNFRGRSGTDIVLLSSTSPVTDIIPNRNSL